jgi:hypothetical protein
MGLDMYLEKRTYVKNWEHNKKHHKFSIKFDGKERRDIKKKRITAIVEDVAYWRKCWNIHNWIMSHFDGDGSGIYYIDRGLLEELLEICKEVMLGGVNEFQFDEFEAKTTYEQLKELLAEDSAPEGAYSGDFYYQASW